MQTYPVLSVLIAPAIVLASALFVDASARAFRALIHALGWRLTRRSDPPRMPPARTA
jgi:hypothetical protein